jgi:hypothetical protein
MFFKRLISLVLVVAITATSAPSRTEASSTLPGKPTSQFSTEALTLYVLAHPLLPRRILGRVGDRSLGGLALRNTFPTDMDDFGNPRAALRLPNIPTSVLVGPKELSDLIHFAMSLMTGQLYYEIYDSTVDRLTALIGERGKLHNRFAGFFKVDLATKKAFDEGHTGPFTLGQEKPGGPAVLRMQKDVLRLWFYSNHRLKSEFTKEEGSRLTKAFETALLMVTKAVTLQDALKMAPEMAHVRFEVRNRHDWVGEADIDQKAIILHADLLKPHSSAEALLMVMVDELKHLYTGESDSVENILSTLQLVMKQAGLRAVHDALMDLGHANRISRFFADVAAKRRTPKDRYEEEPLNRLFADPPQSVILPLLTSVAKALYDYKTSRGVDPTRNIFPGKVGREELLEGIPGLPKSGFVVPGNFEPWNDTRHWQNAVLSPDGKRLAVAAGAVSQHGASKGSVAYIAEYLKNPKTGGWENGIVLAHHEEPLRASFGWSSFHSIVFDSDLFYDTNGKLTFTGVDLFHDYDSRSGDRAVEDKTATYHICQSDPRRRKAFITDKIVAHSGTSWHYDGWRLVLQPSTGRALYPVLLHQGPESKAFLVETEFDVKTGTLQRSEPVRIVMADGDALPTPSKKPDEMRLMQPWQPFHFEYTTDGKIYVEWNGSAYHWSSQDPAGRFGLDRLLKITSQIITLMIFSLGAHGTTMAAPSSVDANEQPLQHRQVLRAA